MKAKKIFSSKITLLILLICFIPIFDAVKKIQQQKNKPAESKTLSSPLIIPKKDTYPDLPTRLIISKININVPIENVGQDSNGIMEIPKDTQDVGWFELGKKPGEIGSAVIAGHYGLYKGVPTIFNELHELEKGDEISVEDKSGNMTTFIVKESKKYNPIADTTEIFSSDDEKAHLNLITCDGAWNKDSKSFDQRLVIFSDKE